MRNAFESKLVDELLAQSDGSGYGLLLAPITERRTTEQALEQLLENRVEAIIGFTPSEDRGSLPARADTTPIVWLGGPAPDVDNVHIDDHEGMRLAIEYLMRLGHTEIAHLRGNDGPAGKERAHAYAIAMERAGLAAFRDVVGHGFTEEDGAAAASQLLNRSRLPTALLCAGDASAAGALAVFRARGVRVSDDVSVIGWDDSRLARLSYLSLTSVKQDIETTARYAMQLVGRRLSNPSAAGQIVLTAPELTVRASTGTVRAP